MNPAPSLPTSSLPPVLPEPAPRPEATLRRLFLTLFLRGRSSRGLSREGAPNSIGQKLGWTLFLYGAMGCLALGLLRQPVFALAVYLHAMTFVFLGMFVAASAGEILFNKEEGDILMHRPVSARTLLWAKIRVLVEVSLWLAGAFNLAGLLAGWAAHGWRWPLVHALTTGLEALFCTGCVVLVYQLCLRWFGRERLEGVMTMAQVMVAVAAVMAGQILPRVVFRIDHVLTAGQIPWWINVLPPAWFAGLDDALAGSAAPASWLLGGLALGFTGLVLWLAFGKLAQAYATGLQTLNETVSPRGQTRNHRRWLDRLAAMPPLSWWLRDPVSRASFLLAAAYLIRDRDVKLRVYPAMASILVIPFIFLLQGQGGQRADDPGLGVPFAGVYLGMVPLYGLQMLQFSQQWQAADIFRVAPLAGPAAIGHGARRAALCLAVPMLGLMLLIVWILRGNAAELLLFLPGVIALPVFSLVPMLGGGGVPLSRPTDAAKAANRGANMILVMMVSFALAELASWAWSAGWFRALVLVEAVAAAGLYAGLRVKLAKTSWPVME